jgi:hypothetical protein
MDKKPLAKLPQHWIAGAERGFHGLISAIEQPRIEVADLPAVALPDALEDVIDRDDVRRCERILMAARGEVGAPVTRLESHVSWADRPDDDIDGEILAWIASHVHSRKRPKSTLI